MKVTTLYWGGIAIDMHMLMLNPDTLDFSGYSLFGFDALQLLAATGDDEVKRLVNGVFIVETGINMTRSLTDLLFNSFVGDDIIQRADSPMFQPFVTFDGAYKLVDVLPANEQQSYMEFMGRVIALMRKCCEIVRATLDERSYDVEDESGNKKRIYRKVPLRCLVLELHRCMAIAALDGASTEDKSAHTDFFKYSDEKFLTESDVATTMKLPTLALRNMLVQRGFLHVKRHNGKIRYELSRRSIGYGIASGRGDRIWHISLLKLLEQGE